MQPSGRVYLGCSGWAYTSWKPDFYPPGTPSKKFLNYYATQLNSVEVNFTFRKLPTAAMIRNWLASVEGSNFLFSFKAPQSITHFKRLKDCEDIVQSLYESVSPVMQSSRMGVLLFQLPPNFKADRERLASFLATTVKPERKFAFEFRHASWFSEEVFSLLREHNVALCVAESDDLQTPDVRTSGFSCYRLRKSTYSADALKQMAHDFKNRTAQGDVFAYFMHEDEPSGPQRARTVLEMVSGH